MIVFFILKNNALIYSTTYREQIPSTIDFLYFYAMIVPIDKFTIGMQSICAKNSTHFHHHLKLFQLFQSSIISKTNFCPYNCNSTSLLVHSSTFS
jgi:hypothetical protein